MPSSDANGRHVYNQYCVRVKDGRRDEILKELRGRQVGCMVYYPKPLHLQTCFAPLGYQAGQFPEAEKACQDILALPIYPELPAAHQDRVVSALVEVCHGCERSQVIRKAA